MVPGTGNRYVSLNTTVPPFDDINVRKAVVAAADREALRLERGGEIIGPDRHALPPADDARLRGGGRPRRRPGPRLHPGPERAIPELAAEYFREAGYESGKYEGDEEILIVAENAGVDKRVGEAVNDLFEELGFNVTFRQVNGDIMYTKFCNRPDAEVAVCPNVGWLKDFNDPQSMLEPTFDGDAIAPVNNSNWPELDVPEINEAMDEARLITDPDERAAGLGRDRHDDHGAGAGDPLRVGRPAERLLGERERGDEPVQRADRPLVHVARGRRRLGTRKGAGRSQPP